jgi:GDP-L-fucose synthase
MKILVTGGNGFLGTHVCNQLRTSPHTILSPTSKELNLLDKMDSLRYIKEIKPDIILHMAAICGGILANKNSPADFLHKNVDIGSNLFHAAKEAGCSRVYSLGSVCAYPKFCPTPFKEGDLWNGYPEETNAPYGISKRLLLMLQQTYREQYGFTGAHLILVNLYGEYDNFDLTNSHVIPALIHKFDNAYRMGLPTVDCWGTGDATREFLYAGDAAQIINQVVTTNFDSSSPINIGTGQDISIKKLSALIAKLTRFNGKIIFTGQVSDGQPKRILDVTRSKELLGWSATTSLEAGILKTIQWYQNH